MRARHLAIALVTSALAACETSPVVTDQVSHDGLTKVERTGFDQVWVKQGYDLAPYKRIKLEGVGIEYRPVDCRSATARRASAERFCLDDRQKERLQEIMKEAFTKELGKSTRFTLTNETGPDVLLIRGALLDVVSYVPPDLIGRGDVFLSSVGEATLIFEIRDSTSNSILARVADRRAAESGTNMPERSNRVSNAYDVERAARAWAAILRERLDRAATLAAPSA
jgi:Protein of unknown function (DUF3313)